MAITYAPQVTVAEWMAVRERIAEELKQGSPQAKLETRIRQAELLLTAGLIDVEQILRGDVEVDEDVIIPGTWVEMKPSIDPDVSRPVGCVVGTTGYSLWVRWFGNAAHDAFAREFPLEDMQRKTDRLNADPVEKLADELGISKAETKPFVGAVEKLTPKDELPEPALADDADDAPGMAFFPGDSVVVTEGLDAGKRGTVQSSVGGGAISSANARVKFDDGSGTRAVLKTRLAFS